MVEFARKYFRHWGGGKRFEQLHTSTRDFVKEEVIMQLFILSFHVVSEKSKKDKGGRDPAEMIKFSKVVCTHMQCANKHKPKLC